MNSQTWDCWIWLPSIRPRSWRTLHGLLVWSFLFMVIILSHCSRPTVPKGRLNLMTGFHWGSMWHGTLSHREGMFKPDATQGNTWHATVWHMVCGYTLPVELDTWQDIACCWELPAFPPVLGRILFGKLQGELAGKEVEFIEDYSTI